MDTDTSASEADKSKTGSRAATGITVLFVVLALVLSWAVRAGSGIERVEREHGITLPDSVTEVQALGDASRAILRFTNLDRGASSIFVMDEADVGALLEEFGGDALPSERSSGAPGNTIYQPLNVPWTGPEDLEMELLVETDASAGDFTSIQIYTLDGDKVGVWLYTDWN